MHDYAKELAKKGWTGQLLARRWGRTPRSISNISRRPTQRDWDALAGLPDKSEIVDERDMKVIIYDPDNVNFVTVRRREFASGRIEEGII